VLQKGALLKEGNHGDAPEMIQPPAGVLPFTQRIAWGEDELRIERRCSMCYDALQHHERLERGGVSAFVCAALSARQAKSSVQISAFVFVQRQVNALNARWTQMMHFDELWTD
jgi:hypothetical protein